MYSKLFITLALSLSIFTGAEARPKASHTRLQPPETQFIAPDIYSPNNPFESLFHTKKHPPTTRGRIIGGRPSGCPHAFCGCGASLYLFGKIIPELNLAWNWARKFRHISPQEAHQGDVAVRRGHVAVVLENKGGGIYTLHDSNSGGHRTRIHDRHLAGYVFVRPS